LLELAKKKAANAETNSHEMGTRTSQYLEFLKEALIQLDRLPELKGFYLVMDGASIHMHGKINLITNRG
jgi:hypothetical protein